MSLPKSSGEPHNLHQQRSSRHQSPLSPTVAFSEVKYLALDTTTPRRWLSFLYYLIGGKLHSLSPISVWRNVLYTPAFSNLTHFDGDTQTSQGCSESDQLRHLLICKSPPLGMALPQLPMWLQRLPNHIQILRTRSLSGVLRRVYPFQHHYSHSGHLIRFRGVGTTVRDRWTEFKTEI